MKLFISVTARKIALNRFLKDSNDTNWAMPSIFIETQRLILRQWKKTDYIPYIKLNQDKEVMELFPSVKTEEESLAHILKISNQINISGCGLFAVERKDNQQFIGFTGFSHPGFESYFTPCVEIGWRLSKHNWNMGFATEAASACLEFGFNKLNFNDIYSFTSVNNKRSEQVMIKIGMIKHGFFDHPLISEGHILKPHVLYKISR